jgi:hypothetical protein
MMYQYDVSSIRMTAIIAALRAFIFFAGGHTQKQKRRAKLQSSHELRALYRMKLLPPTTDEHDTNKLQYVSLLFCRSHHHNETPSCSQFAYTDISLLSPRCYLYL